MFYGFFFSETVLFLVYLMSAFWSHLVYYLSLVVLVYLTNLVVHDSDSCLGAFLSISSCFVDLLYFRLFFHFLKIKGAV